MNSVLTLSQFVYYTLGANIIRQTTQERWRYLWVIFPKAISGVRKRNGRHDPTSMVSRAAPPPPHPLSSIGGRELAQVFVGTTLR